MNNDKLLDHKIKQFIQQHINILQFYQLSDSLILPF